MDQLRIVPPRAVTAAIVAHERRDAERAELRSRAQDLIHAIDAKIRRRCHYCESGLYEAIPPGGCPACKPARNGAVAHRSAADSRVVGYQRGAVEIRPAAITGFR